MNIQECITLIANNGISLVVIAMLLVGAWKGIPAMVSYFKEKFDMFIESQIEKDKEIIASVKEIQANNSTLVKAIDNIDYRVTKVEKTVDEILEVVTK